MGNGRALHFGTQRLGDGDDMLLLCLFAHKLVAAGHSAQLGMAGIGLLGSDCCQFDQFLIRLKAHGHTGNLAHGVTKGAAIKIVVHSVPADHQVADIQVSTERTGNSRIHHSRYIKAVAQHLHAQRCVHRADAALDDHYGHTL